MAQLSGLSAEAIVERHLVALGASVLAKRWRGQGGELDLVLREGDTIVFVEVKKAATFEAALGRVTAGQVRRILTAAEEFIAARGLSSLTDVRCDLALVDRHGAVEIMRNPFACQ